MIFRENKKLVNKIIQKSPPLCHNRNLPQVTRTQVLRPQLILVKVAIQAGAPLILFS
jgi:hypothetical protein